MVNETERQQQQQKRSQQQQQQQQQVVVLVPFCMRKNLNSSLADAATVVVASMKSLNFLWWFT